MKKRTDGYIENTDGTITYNTNNHTNRFSFLKPESTFLKGVNEETYNQKSLRSAFTDFMMAIIGEDPSKLNYEELIEDYLKRGIGDIPYTVWQYIWERYGISGILKPQELEDMYLNAVDYLNELADQGKLPRKNIVNRNV